VHLSRIYLTNGSLQRISFQSTRRGIAVKSILQTEWTGRDLSILSTNHPYLQVSTSPPSDTVQHKVTNSVRRPNPTIFR